MVLRGFQKDLGGFWRISGGSGGGESVAVGGNSGPLRKVCSMEGRIYVGK